MIKQAKLIVSFNDLLEHQRYFQIALNKNGIESDRRIENCVCAIPFTADQVVIYSCAPVRGKVIQSMSWTACRVYVIARGRFFEDNAAGKSIVAAGA